MKPFNPYSRIFRKTLRTLTVTPENDRHAQNSLETPEFPQRPQSYSTESLSSLCKHLSGTYSLPPHPAIPRDTPDATPDPSKAKGMLGEKVLRDPSDGPSLPAPSAPTCLLAPAPPSREDPRAPVLCGASHLRGAGPGRPRFHPRDRSLQDPHREDHRLW